MALVQIHQHFERTRRPGVIVCFHDSADPLPEIKGANSDIWSEEECFE